jgi:hypothetical protein
MDSAVLDDHGRDFLVASAMFAQEFDLIADHADEGIDGKLFRAESGGLAQIFLRFDGFFDGVEFWLAHALFLS